MMSRHFVVGRLFIVYRSGYVLGDGMSVYFDHVLNEIKLALFLGRMIVFLNMGATRIGISIAIRCEVLIFHTMNKSC